MNKNLYRLIFDRRLGMLVPVAEILTAQGKTNASGEGRRKGSVRVRVQALAAALWVGWLSGPLWAQGSSPGMTDAANGVPAMNIVAPDSTGLSHNVVTDLNVDDRGLIFNNSDSDGVTQIGGLLLHNPNLTGVGPATAILTEVTGGLPSTLSGALEVFGRRADVLIANENGLTVNGVSTINAGSLVLSTGRPVRQADGSLGFAVGQGAIDVTGRGVNTDGLTYFDVVARSVALNAPVTGTAGTTDIRVLSGLNDYDAGTRGYTVRQATATGAPQYGVTGSVAGAMYGGQIALISTESGVGVRHEGAITALSDVQVSADGDVTVGGAWQAADTASVRGRNVAVAATGQVLGAAAVTVDADQVLENAGRLQSATGSVSLAADVAVVNTGVVDAFGTTAVSGQGSVTNSGADALIGGGAVAIAVAGEVANRDGALIAAREGGLTLQAHSLLNSGANSVLQSTQGLQIATDDGVRNEAGAVLGAGTELNIAAAGAVSNVGADARMLGQRVTVRTGSTLENLAGAQITGATQVSLSAHDLVNDAADISAAQVALTATQALENRGAGVIQASDALGIDAATLVNRDGALLQASDVQLHAVEALDNAVGARIVAGESLTIDGGEVRNAAALIQARNATVQASGSVSNTAAGQIQAGEALRIESAVIANDGAGSALAGREVTLRTGALGNTDGASIVGATRLEVSADTLTNDAAVLMAGALAADGSVQTGDANLTVRDSVRNADGATLAATGTLALTTSGSVSNSAASVIAGQDVQIVAGQVGNTDSQIRAGAALGVTADSVDNTGATGLIDGQQVTVTTQGRLHNAAQIEGRAAVSLDVAQLDNTAEGEVLAGEAVSIATGDYRNAGTLASDGDATLTVAGDLAVTASSLAPVALGLLTVHAQDVRVATRWEAPGSVAVHASGTFDNDEAVIVAHDLSIDAAGAVNNNDDALLWAGNDLSARGASVTNASGAQIQAQRDVRIQADSVTNRGTARITGGQDVAIDTPQLLNQATVSGSITQGPDESASAAHDDYHDARHEHYELSLDGIDTLTSGLTAAPGVIEAGRDVLLNQGPAMGTGATVSNENGRIVAGRDVRVDGNVFNRPAGQSEPLWDYLQRPATIRLKVEPWSNIGTSLWSPTTVEYGSLLALLNVVMDDANPQHSIGGPYYWWNDQVLKTLAQANTSPMLNQVMNAVLGPDWKSLDYATQVARWKAFAGNPGASAGLQFYADTQTELAAGRDVVSTGGRIENGDNTAPTQRTVTVQVGQYTVDTTLGQFEAQVNLSRLSQTLNPLTDLAALLGNAHLYRRNDGRTIPEGAGGVAPLTFPLYESNNRYRDPNGDYGADYFLRQIGAVLEPTPAVLADEYLTTQLVTRLVERDVGSWFLQRDGLYGSALVKHLMDAGVAAQAPLGLTVGVAPTAAQLAQSKQDFLWYVWEDVEGQRVLVPQVYLTAATLAQVRSGGGVQGAGTRAVASIASHGATRISADSGGVSNINGVIRGRLGTSITTTGQVVNAAGAGINGGLESQAGTVDVRAAGDVRNAGAHIAGQDVAILSGGRFTSEAGMGYDAQGRHAVRSNGEIVATDGDVSIEAAGDVDLTGSTIQGAGDVSVRSTGGALATHDVHVVDSAFSSQSRQVVAGYTHSETTQAAATAVSTTIGAGEAGTLTLRARDDVELNGGSYSGNVGEVRSDRGEVRTTTSQDYAYEKQSTVTEQFVAGAEGGIAGEGGEISYGTIDGTQDQRFSDYTNQKAMDGKLNKGKAVQGQLAGASFGYEKTETVDTTSSRSNRNAQLSFGDALRVEAQGKVDIGGADLSVADDGRLSVTGKEVLSTKFEDETVSTSEEHRTSLKIEGETHSAIADTINHSRELTNKADEGMTVDPGMTTLQAVGDVSNLVFGDAVGASLNVAIKREDTTSRSTTRSQNQNTLKGGNISIQSTQGDIDLVGVQIEAKDEAVLDAAGALKLSAAQTTTESSSDYQMHQVTGGLNAGTNIAFMQASVGASVGYNGALDKTRETSTNYTNSHVNGGKVTLRSGGDTALVGANVEADTVNLDVGGDLSVKSVQDTHSMTHEKADWGTQVGVSIAATGQQGPVPLRASLNISGQAGYGQDHDDSALTAERSGIQARQQLNAEVGGDLTLQGAALVSETGAGRVHVEGTTQVLAQEDYQEKDGGYANAGGGMGVNGLPTINLGAERVDQIHYRADQRSAIAVNDFASDGGVQGPLQRTAEGLTQVTRDEKIAGNTAAITIDADAVNDKVEAHRQRKAEVAQQAGDTGSVGGDSLPDQLPGNDGIEHDSYGYARVRPQAERTGVADTGTAPRADAGADTHTSTNSDANAERTPAADVAKQGTGMTEVKVAQIPPDLDPIQPQQAGIYRAATPMEAMAKPLQTGGNAPADLMALPLPSTGGNAPADKVATTPTTGGNAPADTVSALPRTGGNAPADEVVTLPRISGGAPADAMTSPFPRTGGNAPGDVTATRTTDATTPQPPDAPPREVVRDTKYDQRVIVQLGDDATSQKAAQRIFDKHPDNSVLIQRDAQGNHEVVAGTPATGGKTKLEFVAHTQSEDGQQTLQQLDGHALADETKQVQRALNEQSVTPVELAKLNLVGCDTGACTNGNSLVNQTADALQQQGIDVARVKGYEGRIDLTGDGRKTSVEEGGLGGVLGAMRGSRQTAAPVSAAGNSPHEEVQMAQRDLDRAQQAVDDLKNSLAERQADLGLYKRNGEWAVRPAKPGDADSYARFLRNQAELTGIKKEIAKLSGHVDESKARLESARHDLDMAGVDKALKTVPFSEKPSEMMANALQRNVEPKNMGLFENAPDGLVTAKIMADNDIGPDFVAVRTQNRRHIDYTKGTTQGHQGAVASVENWYSGGRRDKAEVRASDLARSTGQDMLNVDVVPASKVDKSIGNLQRYHKETSEFISFPLRDALQLGARIYPDKGAQYSGSKAFVVGLPRGTDLPVNILKPSTRTQSPSERTSPPRTERSTPGNQTQPSRETAPADKAQSNRDAKYDQRVIVQLGDDVTSQQAAQRIFDKHPDNSVLIQRDAQGNHEVVAGTPATGGKTKLEFVAHTQSEDGQQTLQHLDGHALADETKQVQRALNDQSATPVELAKLNLVGCDTGACTNGNSLANQTAEALQQQGIDVARVKGYEGRIDLTADGHKEPVAEGGLGGALGKRQHDRTTVSYRRAQEGRPTNSRSQATGADEGAQGFKNLHPDSYESEVRYAKAIGVEPIGKGTPEFSMWLNQKVGLKWVYTTNHELFIAVGVEGSASHAVLAGGAPVLTAGTARWNGGVLELDNATGHYRTSQESLERFANEAWGGLGFPIRTRNRQADVAAQRQEHRRQWEESARLLGHPFAGGDTKYDQRVIVQLGDDATSQQAAQRIFDKHPNNSVLIQRDAQGNHQVVAGTPATGGKTKLEFVSHTQSEDGQRTMQQLDSNALADETKQVQRALSEQSGVPVELAKLNLVGCDSGTCTPGGSLADNTHAALEQQGVQVAKVKGYEGRVDLTPDGHKQRVTEGGLGSDDDRDPPPTSRPPAASSQSQAGASQATSAATSAGAAWNPQDAGFVPLNKLADEYLAIPVDQRPSFEQYARSRGLTGDFQIKMAKAMVYPSTGEVAWPGRDVAIPAAEQAADVYRNLTAKQKNVFTKLDIARHYGVSTTELDKALKQGSGPAALAGMQSASTSAPAIRGAVANRGAPKIAQIADEYMKIPADQRPDLDQFLQSRRMIGDKGIAVRARLDQLALQAQWPLPARDPRVDGIVQAIHAYRELTPQQKTAFTPADVAKHYGLLVDTLLGHMTPEGWLRSYAMKRGFAKKLSEYGALLAAASGAPATSPRTHSMPSSSDVATEVHQSTPGKTTAQGGGTATLLPQRDPSMPPLIQAIKVYAELTPAQRRMYTRKEIAQRYGVMDYLLTSYVDAFGTLTNRGAAKLRDHGISPLDIDNPIPALAASYAELSAEQRKATPFLAFAAQHGVQPVTKSAEKRAIELANQMVKQSLVPPLPPRDPQIRATRQAAQVYEALTPEQRSAYSRVDVAEKYGVSTDALDKARKTLASQGSAATDRPHGIDPASASPSAVAGTKGASGNNVPAPDLAAPAKTWRPWAISHQDSGTDADRAVSPPPKRARQDIAATSSSSRPSVLVAPASAAGSAWAHASSAQPGTSGGETSTRDWWQRPVHSPNLSSSDEDSAKASRPGLASPQGSGSGAGRAASPPTKRPRQDIAGTSSSSSSRPSVLVAPASAPGPSSVHASSAQPGTSSGHTSTRDWWQRPAPSPDLSSSDEETNVVRRPTTGSRGVPLDLTTGGDVALDLTKGGYGEPRDLTMGRHGEPVDLTTGRQKQPVAKGNPSRDAMLQPAASSAQPQTPMRVSADTATSTGPAETITASGGVSPNKSRRVRAGRDSSAAADLLARLPARDDRVDGLVQAIHTYRRLTPQQREAVAAKQVASQYGVSPHMIRTHMRHDGSLQPGAISRGYEKKIADFDELLRNTAASSGDPAPVTELKLSANDLAAGFAKIPANQRSDLAQYARDNGYTTETKVLAAARKRVQQLDMQGNAPLPAPDSTMSPLTQALDVYRQLSDIQRGFYTLSDVAERYGVDPVAFHAAWAKERTLPLRRRNLQEQYLQLSEQRRKEVTFEQFAIQKGGIQPSALDRPAVKDRFETYKRQMESPLPDVSQSGETRVKQAVRVFEGLSEEQRKIYSVPDVAAKFGILASTLSHELGERARRGRARVRFCRNATLRWIHSRKRSRYSPSSRPRREKCSASEWSPSVTARNIIFCANMWVRRGP